MRFFLIFLLFFSIFEYICTKAKSPKKNIIKFFLIKLIRVKFNKKKKEIRIEGKKEIMKTIKNILNFRKLILEKKKRLKNLIQENKKTHIKRNKLFNKKNIINNYKIIPYSTLLGRGSTPLGKVSNLIKIQSLVALNSSSLLLNSNKLQKNIKKQINYKSSREIIINNKDINKIEERNNKNKQKKYYIIFRTTNYSFQHYIRYSKEELKNKGIRIKILEKTFKEFEKEIIKIAKIYNLKSIFINNPIKTLTKKGILIRMGKGKGKIIEKYKILEKNKIILMMVPIKEINIYKFYLLTQILFKLDKKYSFLSKCQITYLH